LYINSKFSIAYHICMKTSEDLFVLIKSLTKTEKRHFKLFSGSASGEKKYLQLFDAISEQEQYDEAAILDQFENEKFVKNFSVAKAYLFESILNSLEVFHSDKTFDGQLRKQINHIKILASKKQYGLCLKLISKAKKLASDFDYYTYAYELSTIEESVMQSLNEIKWLEENYERIYREEDKILEKLKNFQNYRKQSTKSVARGTKQGRSRDLDTVKRYDALKKPKLLLDPSKALSDRALITYYFLNGTYHYFRNDNSGSLGYFLELKKFIESKPHYPKLYFHPYLYSLNNIISVGMGILRFEEMLETLDALKNIKYDSPAENASIQLRYYIQLTHILIYYGRYAEAFESIPEIETWFKNNSRNELHKAHKLTLLLNISIIYFTAGNYKICLSYLNRMLNTEAKDMAYDTYGFVRLLNLIVHFELGNHDLLPSITRSTYRYFYKHKRLYKFETMVLDFIRTKAIRMNTKEERIIAFRELKAEFKKIIKDPLEKNALEYFDFESWLESKIENKSFVEIVRKKSRPKTVIPDQFQKNEEQD
jgi:hypothetical protein